MSHIVSMKELFEAVEKGETTVVNKVSGLNSDLITAVDAEGQTLLHKACLQNDPTMVALLLSKVPDTEVRNNMGKTSFDIANDFGYFEIIKLFLRHKQKSITFEKVAYLLRTAIMRSDLELLDVIIENYKDACIEKDENENSILHFSVEQNNFETTKRLVYSGVEVNCKNKYGQLPIHISSKENFFLISRLLLHTDPETANVQDSAGFTALHYAAQNNNGTFVGELLTEGAVLDLPNINGMTPVHIAVLGNCHDAIVELMNHKPNINLKDKEGHTILHFSVFMDNYGLARELVCSDSDINCQNNYGQTPLHIAVERNNLDLIELFLRKSLFNAYDAQDSNGNTVLHFAAGRDNYILIDDLASRGATLNISNCNGQTPLHIAIQGDCHQAFDRLIYLGAEVNIKDDEGRAPLHLAVSRGILSVVGRLVDSGADLELRDNYGQTPIHYAANCQSLQVLKYLYFSGAEITTNFNQQTLIHVASQSCPYWGLYDQVCRKCCHLMNWIVCMDVDLKAQDMRGETALHYGARTGCIPLLRHVREPDGNCSGVLLEIKNEDGQTALHQAALYNWQMFDLLLREKADPDSKDYRGVTPFEILIERFENMEDSEEESGVMNIPVVDSMIHYFVSSRLLNIVDLLLKRNSDIEARYNGDTLLIFAAERGLKKETQFLLERGANVNAKNDAGLTALHIAVMKSGVLRSCVNVANVLILGGADVNAKSRDGKTPLHMTLEKENVYPSLLRILLNNGAIVDVKDFKGKTPLDYNVNMKNPLIKTLLRHHLIMLRTVNMLSIPIDFEYCGYQDFHKCCLEEIELMKTETYGKNSLYHVFSRFENPTYIFNTLLEMKMNSLKSDESKIYQIYGSLLHQTYQRAKDRYKLLQNAQDFFKLLNNSPFQPNLPDEVQRMILFNLCDNDLETLVQLSQIV